MKSQARSAQSTAVADANLAATGQAEAEAGQSTTVADANLAATGQAIAEAGQGTAVAAYSLAATAQAVAENDLLTAIVRADLAGTAQAIAEAGQGTTVANAYLTATEQSLQLTATAESQLAAAPPDTPTPTPESPIAGQHFVSEQGAIEFDYPAEWVATEIQTGFIAFANSQSALSGPLQAGGFLGFVFTVPATGDADSELTRVALALGQELSRQVSQVAIDFASQSQITLGGHRSSRVEGANDAVQMVVFVIDPGQDRYLVLIGMTLPGELAAFERELLMVGASVHYTAPG